MADQDHEHDIVPVTDAGGDTQYDYCRTCPWRSESYPVPEPPTEDELAEIQYRAAEAGTDALGQALKGEV